MRNSQFPIWEFNGIWYNDYRSVLELLVRRSGVVTGFYQLHPAATDKQERIALTGAASRDRIAFSVDFRYGTLTSWIGQLIREASTAETVLVCFWHTITDVGDPNAPKSWAMLTGLDVYRRSRPDLSFPPGEYF